MLGSLGVWNRKPHLLNSKDSIPLNHWDVTHPCWHTCSETPPVLYCCAPSRQGAEGWVPTCSAAVGCWQVAESSEGGPYHLVHALEGSTGAPESPFSFCFLATIKRTGLSHATMMCRPKATRPHGHVLQSWKLQGQRNLYFLKSWSSQFLYSTAMETKVMCKVGVAAVAAFSSYNSPPPPPPPLLLLVP